MSSLHCGRDMQFFLCFYTVAAPEPRRKVLAYWIRAHLSLHRWAPDNSKNRILRPPWNSRIIHANMAVFPFYNTFRASCCAFSYRWLCSASQWCRSYTTDGCKPLPHPHKAPHPHSRHAAWWSARHLLPQWEKTKHQIHQTSISYQPGCSYCAGYFLSLDAQSNLTSNLCVVCLQCIW